MHRYTTPTLVFNLPIDTDILEEAFVSLSQFNNVVIEKSLGEMIKEEKTLKVTLSQEDTSKLKSYGGLLVQLRCKDSNGNAYASKIFKVAAEQVLKEGVI